MQRVVARSAPSPVAPARAAGHLGQVVVAIAEVDPVVALPRIDPVVARTGIDLVVSSAALDDVAILPALEAVLARPAAQEVPQRRQWHRSRELGGLGRASLTTGRAFVGTVEDTLVGIENLLGSRFNDTLAGEAGANELFGAATTSSRAAPEIDRLSAGSGYDILLDAHVEPRA